MQGQSFDDFLAEDGLLEEVTEAAAKRVLARSFAAQSDEELFDVAMAEGPGEAVPQAVMARLVAGENPVKVYREWRGLSQGDLAAKISVTPGYVSQVERGVRQLSRKTQTTAENALGVLPDDLEPVA